MLSKKQIEILRWPYAGKTALICDGAVRSGKTSIMSLSFVLWAMGGFNQRSFGLCGKTVASAERNIIRPLQGVTYFGQNGFALNYTRSGHVLTVTRGTRSNRFYVFGGRDESSYMLIQGITLAGVLFDEVALMPRSFVEQALARCSVEGSKFWFNCNPESPAHWFYKNWIEGDKPTEKNASYIHFTMEDNPSLSREMRERYENMFSGIFFQRYVQGLWVVAEGLIYSMFTPDKIVPDEPRQYRKYAISMDYGTRNPTAMLLWGLCDGVWYAFKEYYFSSRVEMAQKTDQEYYDDLCKFAGELPIDHIIIDPSALSFITLVERKHRFKVLSADNDVLDGIRHTAQCLYDGTIKICKSCKNLIKELNLYSWDEDATEDRPIKDNDHCMDAMRYFVQTMGIWFKKSGRTLF